MAIMEENLRKSIYVKLTTGENQYANVSMGPINPEANPTNSQIWAMRTALAPILQGTASKVIKIYTSELEDVE